MQILFRASAGTASRTSDEIGSAAHQHGVSSRGLPPEKAQPLFLPHKGQIPACETNRDREIVMSFL
jgi:hypothetical protein